LVPERAVIETATIFTNLDPANLIGGMLWTALLVEALDLTVLLREDNTVSAVVLLPLFPVPGETLNASGFIGA